MKKNSIKLFILAAVTRQSRATIRARWNNFGLAVAPTREPSVRKIPHILKVIYTLIGELNNYISRIYTDNS